MKRIILSARLIAAILIACLLAISMPVNAGRLTARAAVNTGNCPANLYTGIFKSESYVSLNGNAASRTTTYCIKFHHTGKIKVKSNMPNICTASYKIAGTVKGGRYLFITFKFKDTGAFVAAMNYPMEDWTPTVPYRSRLYQQELKGFTIGSKKYNATKSFCYTGGALKNKKVTVTPKSGLKIKCLYVVDNFEKARKNADGFTIKKRYSNGAKVTVPSGCSLHAVLNTGGANEPDFCIYTATGIDSGGGSSSSSTGKKSSAPAQTKITKSFWNPSGSYAIQWKTVKGAAGYQVDVASNSSFKNAFTRTYDSTVYGCSTTISSSVKTSYFRVRAYKKVNGKVIYGKWSATKTVKNK